MWQLNRRDWFKYCKRRECDNLVGDPLPGEVSPPFHNYCSWECMLAECKAWAEEDKRVWSDFAVIRSFQPGMCSCGHPKRRHSRWPRSMAKKKSRQRGPLMKDGGGWRYQMNGCHDCDCMRSFDWDVEEL